MEEDEDAPAVGTAGVLAPALLSVLRKMVALTGQNHWDGPWKVKC